MTQDAVEVTDRAVLNPIQDDALYDFIVLAGETSPGLAVVGGASNPRKLDKKDGKGASGATIEFNGRGLAEFEVELTLWKPEHFEQWASFKLLLDDPEKALDIWHPELDELGISAVMCGDYTQSSQSEDGIFTKKIKFTQWRKPTPDAGVPQGADAGGGASDDQAPPEDKYDQQINELTQQVQKEL